MKTSAVGRQLIESFEGLILKTYDDANDRIVRDGDVVRGVLTIGYGHTTSAGLPVVRVGQVITKEQADQYLANDLGKVEKEVTNLVKVPLNQNQFDALVSFHFNTGALGKSSALKVLNAGDYKSAADSLTLYNRASQLGPGPIPGLVRRREAEKALFLKPTSSAQHGGATAVVVAGGAALTQTPHHQWPYIIAGTLVAAVIVWLTIHWYRSRQVVKEIADVAKV